MNIATRRLNFIDAVRSVSEAVIADPALLPILIGQLDRKAVEACLARNVKIIDYPADVETLQIAIWDNDFGKRVSKIDARYCVQVQANRMGNINLKKPDFKAHADLIEPKKLKRRSRNWALSQANKAWLDEVLAFAESKDALVGRLMRKGPDVVGSHTFANHYVVVIGIGGDEPQVLLHTPKAKGSYVADKLTADKGKEFPVLQKASGQRSKVIRQCRHSSSTVKAIVEWAS